MQNNINPNEGTVISMCRLAAADNDGDYAFELVKNLERYGDKARLRTYDPALFCFVEKREAEKAYLVEEEILRNGLCLEESEINALLKVSVEVGDEGRVYEYLHKMRGSVRCVSESSAGVVGRWFRGEVAAKVGKGLGEGDMGRVKDAVLRNGGGWHGLGWIGSGEWDVKRTNVGSGGGCCACGEELVCVDIGRDATEKFAQSVVGLAVEREKRSNFTQFQDWLDQRNEFEAIVDGANIGLYQQNFAEGGFSVSQQLEVVVNELYKRSNKWPLVILHDKRIRGLIANPANRGLLQGWIDNGILYGTPVGSNDDWYWLYASVKLKCMLVTNDQMRDHIFELLGSSFFPMWKERHQVKGSILTPCKAGGRGKVGVRLSTSQPPPYIVEDGIGTHNPWKTVLGVTLLYFALGFFRGEELLKYRPEIIEILRYRGWTWTTLGFDFGIVVSFKCFAYEKSGRLEVHYTFPKGQLKLQMPPSYSLVIQESERGAWHVPIAGEYNDESLRTWLCITRLSQCKASDEVSVSAEAVDNGKLTNGNTITGKRKER
ncbi:proteinaceous RNase P 2 [Tanacetum coccineum]